MVCLLKHRARILAPVVEGVDAYGHPHDRGTEQVYDALPCFAWIDTQVETVDGAKNVTITRLNLVADRDAVISYSSVIAGVSDRLENPIVSGSWRVEQVYRRGDQVRVEARKVSGGRA